MASSSGTTIAVEVSFPFLFLPLSLALFHAVSNSRKMGGKAVVEGCGLACCLSPLTPSSSPSL